MSQTVPVTKAAAWRLPPWLKLPVIAGIAITHGRARVDVGASIGVAPLVEDQRPTDVIDAADRAMYARKDEKRGLPAPVTFGG